MRSAAESHLQPSDEVAEALATGAPLVALESTIISHGLPQPRNLEVARELEEIVRAAGAVPATASTARPPRAAAPPMAPTERKRLRRERSMPSR